MRESIYLETTVVSYYTSKPSRDIIVLAHQEITREWWPEAIKRFEVFISEVVVAEASLGDPQAARRRLKEIETFPHLMLSGEVEEMAQVYMETLGVPDRFLRDAVHLAVACIHDIDYLVTWNCTHIANGEIIKKLISVNQSSGIQTPVICTPEELMGV